MGCDFYTYYKICIEYKNGDETKIVCDIDESTLEREYFGDGYDEDYIYICLANYEDEIIYEKNKWLCEENEKYKYNIIMKAYGIDERDIICIWKEGDFDYR